jgi:hypothetical protein
VPDFTNIFHTLHTKLGIKDSERHLVLKYCSSLHRYIQTKVDYGHLILGHDLPICRQNRAEGQIKDVEIWAWEPLTIKARKWQPQPTEQRTEKRWTISGQLVQAASK